MKQGPTPDRRVPAEAVGLGLNVVIATLLFGFLGHWVGKRVGAQEALTLAGGLVGAAAGFYSLVLHISGRHREDQEKKSE